MDDPAPDLSGLDAARFESVLSGQAHCDRWLARLADPRGKEVLVLGAGAGTEMLWCLRRGAREVVGVDELDQSPGALEAAIERIRLRPAGGFAFLRMTFDELARLERRFDLVLAGSLLLRVAEPAALLRAAGRLLAAGGRVAFFADRLYYSSAGAHLDCEPWEHLWGDREALRARLLARREPRLEPLERGSLDELLRDSFRLNRYRAADLLAAVQGSGLLALSFGFVPDRNLARLRDHLPRLEPLLSEAGVALSDLAIEGVWGELAPPGAAADLGASPTSHDEVSRWRLGEELRRLEGQADRERQLRLEFHAVLEEVRASAAFRFARLFSRPLRRGGGGGGR